MGKGGFWPPFVVARCDAGTQEAARDPKCKTETRILPVKDAD